MIAQQKLLVSLDHHSLVLRDDSGKFVSDKSISDRICYACGSDKTRIIKSRNKDVAHWYLNHDFDNNVLCTDCFVKIIHYPSRRDIVLNEHRKYIRFKNRKVKLFSNPRSGICSKCQRSRFTHMHHWFYLVIMPWSCTTELCNQCHPKERVVLRNPIDGRFQSV